MARYKIIETDSIDAEIVSSGIVSFGPGLLTHLEAHDLIAARPSDEDARVVGRELLAVVDGTVARQKLTITRALLFGSQSAAEIAGGTGIPYDEVVANLQALERAGVVYRDSSEPFETYSLTSLAED